MAHQGRAGIVSDIEPCPACGALPCDWVNNPHWRAFVSAPKDGSYILAIVAPNDSRYLGHCAGRVFTIRHEGRTPNDYDMGWAVFPGYGGAPDSYFSHWMPLPETPAEAILTQDGEG